MPYRIATELNDGQAAAQVAILQTQLAAVRAKIPMANASQVTALALAKSLAAQAIAQNAVVSGGSSLSDLLEQESQLMGRIQGLIAGRTSLGG